MGFCSKAFLLLLGIAWVPWESEKAVDALVLSENPEYCAKDLNATLAAAPSLEKSIVDSFEGVSVDDVYILQVHAIIRHGARTPWTTPMCWEGYNQSWNCNVTEIVSLSPLPDEGGRGDVSSTGHFRKIYDAFPEDNILGGTCVLGQLVEEGYRQEEENGRILKQAYVCDGPLCLFDNDSAKDLQEKGALYLRSDDEQRTVMSGQIVTANMLDVSGAVLDWHTGDDSQDYLTPNELTCPRLKELSQEAFDSTELAVWGQSTHALRDALESIWGGEVMWDDAFDCIMTTACSGRELPDGMTQDLFDKIAHTTAEQYSFESLYDDSAYGKLAMARLTREIRERMMDAAQGTSPVQFVLISGHDTTLIPFLAAVAPKAWDKTWPRYASLLAIELLHVDGHDGVKGEYFRFVYNGKVLRLDGCEHDICSMDTFLEATQFAVDLDGNEHCCCRNMTQAEVNEVEQDCDNSTSANSTIVSGSNITDGGVGALDPTTVSTPAPTLAEIASSAHTTPPAADNRSGLVESGVAKSAGTEGQGSSGSGGPALGIALACFVIGAIVGGIPAMMYFRSFRYETLRRGGLSYEMT